MPRTWSSATTAATAAPPVPSPASPTSFRASPCGTCSWGSSPRLRGTLEPWLCYYCGECSDECPREAEPGETMMSMRRWLTARYDFTGISGLFYRSREGRAARHRPGGAAHRTGLHALRPLAGQPSASTTVRAPSCPRAWSTGSTGPWPALLVLLLGINCVRMWWFTVGSDRQLKVPPWRLPEAGLPGAAALLHPEALPRVRPQAALGDPPGADAQLSHHARC